MEEKPRLEFPVIGIGASAGGLEAFTDFFDAMPSDAGMAYVLILHLPPDRESMVAEILARHTSMPVRQVEEGVAVEPDNVYVIRPGRTLTIKNGRLHLGEVLEKPANRRPVDDFFRSLAEEQRERAVCIIMSGMGSNGTAGAQVIKAVGGVCIAQDLESAKFPSMPRNLIDSGLADYVLRPEQIPEVLARYTKHPYATGRISPDNALQKEKQAFGEVLAVLRSRSRHDYSGYKKPTVMRRIQRRMSLNQLTALSDYVRLLRHNTAEVTALSDDLVIHVTGFFRDPLAWEALRVNVIAPLVAERESNSSIRVWVTACSSGEEAYTLAILLSEAVDAAGKKLDVKIFATDVAERTLAWARAGVYAGGIESEISPERLERFFDRDDSIYRVKQELREKVVFAPQNILQDPPFSRIDICTCRNLLIYLEPETQKRVLGLIHFGLREGGALFLGTSETIGGVEELFEPVDKKLRIFRRVGPTRHGSIEFPVLRAAGPALVGEDDSSAARLMPRSSIAQMTQRLLMDRFTPAAVVVDRQHRVVLFHGDTSPYLVQPAGEPTRELLLMAREGVRGAIRVALHAAVNEERTVKPQDGFLDIPDGRQRISITVAPLSKATPGYFLVSFAKAADAAVPELFSPDANGEPKDGLKVLADMKRARDELQSLAEELQSSNEELKASNEEVTSVNEELQSTNEELETSKEELQSLNEELITVNAQLQAKMDELERMTNDLASLLSSTDIAVIFLDRQLRIRRFTPAMRDLMDLIPSDIGRPLHDLARKFTDPVLIPDANTVLERLIPIEAEVISGAKRWYMRRVLPYRTIEDRIEGVVITFVDISARRKAEKAQLDSENDYRLLVKSLKEYAVVMLDKSGKFCDWNPGAQHVLGLTADEALGRPAALIFTAEDRAAGVPEMEMKLARETGEASDDRWMVRGDGTRFWACGTMTSLLDDDGTLRGYAKLMRDGTDRKQTEERLIEASRVAEAANYAKDQFLATVSHELRTPLSAILLWSQMMSTGSVPADKMMGAIKTIQRSAESQRQLIEDLLDTARISSGKLRLNLEVGKPAACIREAIESSRPTAETKGVTLNAVFAENASQVMFDPDRLRQITWNLLTNAIKFTPSGGSVTITAGQSGSSFVLEVRDTGRGIEQAFLAQVFSRFAQAEEPRNRHQGGLGLGLTIAKQLTESHGGTIEVSSEGIGHGASFIVQLPLLAPTGRKPRRGDKNKTASNCEGLAGLRVLMVEDDLSTGEAMAAALERYGAVVNVVHNAQAALAAFSTKRPDLIVSDIGLPEMDGMELIRKIRAVELTERSAAVPAIALSAFTQERDRRQALDSGFQSHVAKPINFEDLVRAVVGTLRAH